MTVWFAGCCVTVSFDELLAGASFEGGSSFGSVSQGGTGGVTEFPVGVVNEGVPITISVICLIQTLPLAFGTTKRMVSARGSIQFVRYYDVFAHRILH